MNNPKNLIHQILIASSVILILLVGLFIFVTKKMELQNLTKRQLIISQ